MAETLPIREAAELLAIPGDRIRAAIHRGILGAKLENRRYVIEIGALRDAISLTRLARREGRLVEVIDLDCLRIASRKIHRCATLSGAEQLVKMLQSGQKTA